MWLVCTDALAGEGAWSYERFIVGVRVVGVRVSCGACALAGVRVSYL